MKNKKIVVIGSGFAGMSAAIHLANAGHQVTLLEKNDQTGGRARIWEKDGFTFDMGPSWYWMPEVFDSFFESFGKKTSSYYKLKRLDPAYRVYFKQGEQMDIPANLDALKAEFEKREKGSADKLAAFLKDAEYKYDTAMSDYVGRLSDSILEYADPKLILKSLQLNLFTSLSKMVRKNFKNPLLQSILEFPVLFLGSTPSRTPALYSMMNYADLVKGTWFPEGGMYQISKAFTALAEEKGVRFVLNCEVNKIVCSNGKAVKVKSSLGDFEADIVVSGADYHHTEQFLLDEKDRVYSPEYWNSRTMSPSSLLFFIGVNKKIENILHHNLFFDEDFEQHAAEIYDTPRWPLKPLFYVSAASKTDLTCAPSGCENLFFLIPLAPGLEDNEESREAYFNMVLERLESRSGEKIRDHILFKRSFAMRDFEKDYNSFKGNAYGLANTLRQTAFLKPKIKSSKVKNLFYTGQLSVPGPGVPPAIISGGIASKEILKQIASGKL